MIDHIYQKGSSVEFVGRSKSFSFLRREEVAHPEPILYG